MQIRMTVEGETAPYFALNARLFASQAVAYSRMRAVSDAAAGSRDQARREKVATVSTDRARP